MPIFKTDEELDADLDRLLNGDEPLAPEDSDNAVTDVPDGFKTWVADNAGRLGGNVPYFVRDNRAMVEAVESEETSIVIDAHKYAAHKMMSRAAEKEAYKCYEDPRNNVQPEMSEEMKDNKNQLAAAIGIQPPNIKPNMTHDEADSGEANLDKRKIGGRHNCALSVIAYEARRRGLDVTAVLFSKDEDTWAFKAGADEHCDSVWQTAPRVATVQVRDGEVVLKSLNNATREVGRYHLSWDFISLGKDGKPFGHALVAERLLSGDLVIYCPQMDEYWGTGSFRDIKAGTFKVRRVDNLLFNVDVVSQIVRAL